MSVRIASLHCYPLKSAHAVDLEQARLTRSGIAQDRRWMVVTPAGRFQTQRELPRLALIRPSLSAGTLILGAPGHTPLLLPLAAGGRAPTAASARRVIIWKDACSGLDEGDEAARWLAAVLGRSVRLVRFDDRQARLAPRQWSGAIAARTRFSDGFPLLVLAEASLAELNTRLTRALPMNRFRPNLVLEGLAPYDEDRIHELYDAHVCLRLVKPCARCVITTTDQDSAERDGEEPLRTLRTFRYDAQLQGVTFGVNALIVRGTHASLRCGQRLQVRWKDEAGAAGRSGSLDPATATSPATSPRR